MNNKANFASGDELLAKFSLPGMKKILIIEDEKILLEVLRKKIDQKGYDVSVAEDGEEGLRKMREVRPDLILLDIMMPKKDGFGVLTDMNQDEELAKIPVIVISNSGQPVEIERAKKLGVKEFLIKANFEPDEVIEKMKKVLGDGDSSQKSGSREKGKKSGHSAGKILIVEDDKFLRDLISKKLVAEDFEISSATDGTEALNVVGQEKPDLILLDIILPGINGFDVLKQLKDDARFSKIPVIILSNLSQTEDVKKGVELGAVDFLIKAHFTPTEIVEKIKQILK